MPFYFTHLDHDVFPHRSSNAYGYSRRSLCRFTHSHRPRRALPIRVVAAPLRRVLRRIAAPARERRQHAGRPLTARARRHRAHATRHGRRAAQGGAVRGLGAARACRTDSPDICAFARCDTFLPSLSLPVLLHRNLFLRCVSVCFSLSILVLAAQTCRFVLMPRDAGSGPLRWRRLRLSHRWRGFLRLGEVRYLDLSSISFSVYIIFFSASFKSRFELSVAIGVVLVHFCSYCANMPTPRSCGATRTAPFAVLAPPLPVALVARTSAPSRGSGRSINLLQPPPLRVLSHSFFPILIFLLSTCTFGCV